MVGTARVRGSELDDVLAEMETARSQVVLTSSSERAAAVIRDQVTEGRLRSGARLPEEAMAGALGISRNTLRESLTQLIAERILVRVPHRGVLVASLSSDDVRDIYRARRVIEPGCLRLAASAAPERMAAVQQAVDEGRAAATAGDGDAVASANQHFHRAVVALAGSARLDADMGLLLAEMRLVFHRTGPADWFHLPYVERNAAIAELMGEGRIDAAVDALEAYLDDAEKHLLTTFD